MTNRIGHERGRRGLRRTAVLVSAVGVFGLIGLGSAGTASAAVTLCKGSVAAKSKSNPGKEAKISFSCTPEIRAYGITSNKAITSYTSPPTIGGAPNPYVNCEGGLPGPGFGCGVKNRNSPANCGRSTTVLPAVNNGPPAVNNITGPACEQIIPANSVVTQDVTLATDPCTYKAKNNLLMFLTAGGEPPIATFTPRGDSTAVGEYTSEPFRLKVKGYAACQPDAKKPGASESKKAKSKTGDSAAKVAAFGDDFFKVGCTGDVEPKVPGQPSLDLSFQFTCGHDIRGFTITANKPIDFFGFENEVFLPNGNVSGSESALLQCEGPVPGYGFGCGTTNRQTATNKITAGNRLRAELGVPVNPCKRVKGEPALKFWLTVIGEPRTSTGPNVDGIYVSEPFPLPLVGFDRASCPKPKSKS